MRWSSLALAAYAFASSVAALDAIETHGNKFFNKDGSQFFIKGVAYQLRPFDPLIDTDQCQRDIDLMSDLGVNTIRVYHVDATAKHDGCMKAFADAGIYLLLDLDTFDTYIEPGNLYWNGSQYDRYVEVMDAFHQYDNLLGFYIGNENIASKDQSPAAPYLKAAARDMKAYRDSKDYRKIPVGYSAADIKELRPQLQDYLTCGGNSSEIIDFFSVNSYSWCGESDYKKSTYNVLQEYAKDFPVPIFFSETGCNIPLDKPRTWGDQDAIFSKPMVNDWSGAIIYEWIQEKNKYGIISYGPPAPEGGGENVEDGFTRKGTPTPRNPDFNNLKTKWASIHPTGVSKADYDPKDVSTRPCPTASLPWWEIDGDVSLPALGATVGSVSHKPSNTADSSNGAESPATTTTSSASGSSTSDADANDSSDASDKDDDSDNAASMDKKITTVGATLAGVILVIALIL